MVPESLLRELARLGALEQQEPLARHTTFGVGGPADAFLDAASSAQLAQAVRLCRAAAVPFFVLGSGSNVVVGDRGIRGVVIASHGGGRGRPAPEPGGRGHYRLRVEAGRSFAALARQLAFSGYAGLEWACGIPGTVGGAVVYNAGAYGGCLADVLEGIGVAAGDGDIEVPAADLGLVYRGSAFTRGLMEGRAVLWAEFRLWPGDASELKARVHDYDRRRLGAQPRGRSAGSFFKNPPGQPAWKLIDAVGLRGCRVGGAELSRKHCNFMVNTGGATAADVVALQALARTRVREHFGIDLEAEVALVGEGFGDG